MLLFSVEVGSGGVKNTVEDATCPELSTVEDATCPEINTVEDATCPEINTVEDATSPEISTVEDATCPEITKAREPGKLQHVRERYALSTGRVATSTGNCAVK